MIISGCSQQENAPANASDSQLMDELLGDSSLPTNATASEHSAPPSDQSLPSGTGNQSETTDVRPVSTVTGRAPLPAAAKGERLELHLQQGDRFPLMKTVEQSLVQKSEQFPAMAQTRLSLLMAIQVEQVTDSAILMSVRYNRISYSHDLNGQKLEYDSSVHQNDIPFDVQPYAGMINNGFSFWIGRDNRIRELVGYSEFLQRCVQNVTGERRETLLSEISNRFGDDGVANFIDDSIGLLPYDNSVDPESATRVAVGDVWTREHRMMQPAPVYLTSTYRLFSIDAHTAEIDISGRIASGETVRQEEKAGLKILGGHSLGKCVVDRATGLPLQMDMTRYLNMVVTLADGQQIQQDKTITTTVRAFPETRRPVVMQPGGQPAATAPVRPVAAAAEQRNAAEQIPTAGDPNQPVRAVYPD